MVVFPRYQFGIHQFHYGEWISQSEVITLGTPRGGVTMLVKIDEL